MKELIEIFEENRFGSINPIMTYISYLPINDRVELLSKLLAKDANNINLYDKLSMALVKNNQYKEAQNLLVQAELNNLISRENSIILMDKIKDINKISDYGSIKNYDEAVEMLKESQKSELMQEVYEAMGIQQKCNRFIALLISYCENKTSKKVGFFERFFGLKKKVIIKNEIEEIASEIIKYEGVYDCSAAYPLFHKIYAELDNNISDVKTVKNYELVSSSLAFCIDQHVFTNKRDLKVISCYCHYFSTKAMNKNKKSYIPIKNRLIALILGFDGLFEPTRIALRLPAYSPIFPFSKFKFRDIENSIYRMEVADLYKLPRHLQEFPAFKNRIELMNNDIKQNLFNPDTKLEQVISKGDDIHKKLYEYIDKKITENQPF